MKTKQRKQLKLYEELVEKTKTDAYPGLFKDIKDNSIMTMIEEWESKEALDKHENGAFYKTGPP